MFRKFQHISELYWKHLGKTYLIFWGIVSTTPFLYWILPNFINFDPKLQNFTLLLEIATIIVSIFGFGIALIGSLSIQYSLTKILLRYKYLQILTFAVFIIASKYFLGNFIINQYNFQNIDLLFAAILTITMSFLFIQTFFLIDKMYDPEELIVEVIAPMILIWELEQIKHVNKYRQKNDPINLFELIGKYDAIPLFINPATNFFMSSKPEIENFSKAIYRLAATNSFRVNPFFAYAKEYIDVKNNLNQLFSEINNDSFTKQKYVYFLWNLALSAIHSLAINDRRYNTLFSQTLLSMIGIVLSKEQNHNQFLGKLSNGGTIELFISLRNKQSILNVLSNLLDRKKNNDFHDDTEDQILQLTTALIHDYIIKKSHKLIHNRAFTLDDIQNLTGILNISNKLSGKTQNQHSNLFRIFYSELIIFLPYLNDLNNEFNDSVQEFINTIFNTQYSIFEEIILKKAQKESKLVLPQDEYYIFFIKTLSAQTFRVFDPEKKKIIEKNIKLLRTKLPPTHTHPT